MHPVFRGRQHVHLMGDEAELVAFARSIGMSVRWLQHDSFGIPHFDCTGRFMAAVLADPRVEKLDRRAFVDRWKALRAARLRDR